MACFYILLGDPDFGSCFVSSLNSLEALVTTAWLQILDSVRGSPLPSFASRDRSINRDSYTYVSMEGSLVERNVHLQIRPTALAMLLVFSTTRDVSRIRIPGLRSGSNYWIRVFLLATTSTIVSPVTFFYSRKDSGWMSHLLSRPRNKISEILRVIFWRSGSKLKTCDSFWPITFSARLTETKFSTW